MKKILIVGLLLGFTLCAFGCRNKTNPDVSQPNSDLSSDVSSKIDTASDSEQSAAETQPGNYSYLEVNCEVNERCIFYPGDEFGIFTYNNQYGLVDTNGKVVLDTKYKQLSNTLDDFRTAIDSGGNLYICKKDGSNEMKVDIGDRLAENCYAFSEGYAFVKTNNSDSTTLCIDTKGNIVFETDVEGFTPFENGIAVADFFGTIYAYNTSGKNVWSVKAKRLHMGNSIASQSPKITDGLIVYLDSDKNLYGAVDIAGNQVLEPKYQELTYAGDGLIGVLKYGQWGYMDYKGNMVIEPKYTEAQQFINGKAIVNISGQYSVIDTKGNILFDLKQNVAHYDNGLFYDWDNTNGDMRILNPDGSLVFETSSEGMNYDGVQYGIIYQGGEMFYHLYQNKNKKTYTYYKLIKH